MEKSEKTLAKQRDPAGRHARRPLKIPFRGWLAALWRTASRYGADNVVLIAGGVSFFALLSFVPAMTALASVYGLFTDPMAAASHADILRGVLPPEAFDVFQKQVVRVTETNKTTLAAGAIISLLVALWSANSGMRQFCIALTVVNDETKDRPIYLQIAISFMLTLGAILIFLLAAAFMTAVPVIIKTVFFGALGDAVQVGQWVALFALSAAYGAVIYHFGPDRNPPRWRWCWPGAIAGAALWVAMSVTFSIVMQRFGNVGSLYGPLAGVVVMMLWVEISTVIFLMGAELNQELERQTMVDTTIGPDKPMGERNAVPADEIGPHPNVKALRRRAQAAILAAHDDDEQEPS